MVIDRSLDRYHEPHRACGRLRPLPRACPTGAFPRLVGRRAPMSLFSDGGKPRVDPGRASGGRWPDVHSAVMPPGSLPLQFTLGCLGRSPAKPRPATHRASCQRRRCNAGPRTTLLVWHPVNPPWPVRCYHGLAPQRRPGAGLGWTPGRPRAALCNSKPRHQPPGSARPRNGRLGTAADRVPAPGATQTALAGFRDGMK